MEPSDAFYDLLMHKLRESGLADGLNEYRVAFAIAPYLERFHARADDRVWSTMLRVMADVCQRYDAYRDAQDPRQNVPFAYEQERDCDPSAGQRPPILEPTPLTPVELAWVLGWARDRAGVVGAGYEVALACCAATMLPYFKTGYIQGHTGASIPRYLMQRCADSGWGQQRCSIDKMIEFLGLVRVVFAAGVFAEGPRAAAYALLIDVPFARDVPSLSEPGYTLNPEVRYGALSAMAKGLDWRPLLGPLEKAGLRHLTPEEFAQLVNRYRVDSGAFAFNPRELGAFAAQLMPRLKHAHAAGQPYALLTQQQIEECLSSGQPLLPTLEATGMFELVTDWVNPMQTQHFALRVRDGTFRFSDAAPAKPLCLRSGDAARRWRSVELAAQGLDGRSA